MRVKMEVKVQKMWKKRRKESWSSSARSRSGGSSSRPEIHSAKSLRWSAARRLWFTDSLDHWLTDSLAHWPSDRPTRSCKLHWHQTTATDSRERESQGGGSDFQRHVTGSRANEIQPAAPEEEEWRSEWWIRFFPCCIGVFVLLENKEKKNEIKYKYEIKYKPHEIKIKIK